MSSKVRSSILKYSDIGHITVQRKFELCMREKIYYKTMSWDGYIYSGVRFTRLQQIQH